MSARLALLAAVAAALVAGCGSPDDAGQQGRSDELLVAAEPSLRTPLQNYERTFAGGEVSIEFVGFDEVAEQLRDGEGPDVVLSADPKLADLRVGDDLVPQPKTVASSRLVLAVPKEGAKVRSLADLATPGVKIAMGEKDIAVGAYARTLLRRLGAERRRAILDNVRYEEGDVAEIAGRIMRGQADAGFLYTTDVVAESGKLRAIGLPPRLDPAVSYKAAMAADAEHEGAAEQFIDGLTNGSGADALQAAGFRPPR